MQKFAQALLEDAKRIRHRHLADLGSQSYGSILRKDLKGISHIHMIGAGSLAPLRFCLG